MKKREKESGLQIMGNINSVHEEEIHSIHLRICTVGDACKLL